MAEIQEGKLTDWISTADTPPAHVGEYNASSTKAKNLLRWWNGEYWSEPYVDTFTELVKQHLRRKKAITSTDDIYYRGLYTKPKVFPIYYLRPLK